MNVIIISFAFTNENITKTYPASEYKIKNIDYRYIIVIL